MPLGSRGWGWSCRQVDDRPRKVTSRRLVCLRGMLYAPVYHALKRGPRRTFWSAWPPLQAASKPAAAELLCHWPKVIEYLFTYWCVFFYYFIFFEGERLQETFLRLTQLRRERSQTVPCFVSLPFLLWRFNLTFRVFVDKFRMRCIIYNSDLDSDYCIDPVTQHAIPDWLVKATTWSVHVCW